MQRYQQGICALLISATSVLSTPVFSQGSTSDQSIAVQKANTREISKGVLLKLEQLQKAATEGDEAAQIELGLLYANGFDIPKDHEKAIQWLLAAGEQYKKSDAGCSEHPAVVTLMVMVDKKVLSPKLHTKVTAWLNALGDKRPKLDFTPHYSK